VETAQRELAELLTISGSPLFARLYRWTRQSPQYEVGHLQRIAQIERRLTTIPGLFVTGSGFRAIGIPDCISDGRATAARAADYVGAHS
jgi:oxygen-dependent protoporphyrinogen oxidase